MHVCRVVTRNSMQYIIDAKNLPVSLWENSTRKSARSARNSVMLGIAIQSTIPCTIPSILILWQQQVPPNLVSSEKRIFLAFPGMELGVLPDDFCRSKMKISCKVCNFIGGFARALANLKKLFHALDLWQAR